MNFMDVPHDYRVHPQEACYQSCHLVCSDAIITTDSRGFLNSYNQGAQSLLGYLPVEIIGRPLRDILKGGDQEASGIQRRLEERNEVYIFDSEVIGRDQRIIPVSFSASLLRDGEGIAQGMIAICHDRSQLHRLEVEIRQKDQFFASIVRNSAAAILTLDSDERVTSWNRGAEAVFGYGEAEMLGRSLEILLPEDLKEQKELEKISQAARLEGYLRSYQTRRITKDGRLIDVIFTRTALKDKDGLLIGFSSVIKDITGQKLIERHLAQMEKLSAIGELSAGLAHEIKNPLAGIKGAIEIIRDGLASDHSHRMILGQVLAEVTRIDRIVMNLLSYSKPRKADFGTLDLVALIKQVIALLDNLAEAKRIKLTLKSKEETTLLIADENELKQLFMNLLLNSIEATPTGGSVEVSLEEASDSKLCVWVSDNGSGISPERLNKVFQPFFTTKKAGTGLGLATCKRIVLDHGGEIRVESEVGKGTRFCIEFPLNLAVPMSRVVR
jgi:two-component system sporulation sensor kinase A